jgi:hypothetical protein
VDQISSKRSGGRRVVRCEIILGALALRISLVFEIFAEKLKSTATPFHNPPAATELSAILPQTNFRLNLLIASAKSPSNHLSKLGKTWHYFTFRIQPAVISPGIYHSFK